ncbi:hypothetical protein A2870_04635 [Candidatus Curtissbacteria bacterium RIFCSPHIGHO2_01_FULL_41_11]|uniref:Uncharacterized protein n=1 Tax=Candidatus Curtissbacteria bacterium RIFCSPHIGHO2_01_FULL_41_11 TaxID=1797711 RepID=A0A1F5G5J0_9BACT|nr:MAG: hypothetical protein A2870_04635 [Candidatus Curtissbacteria bacterium RIFCSPHIGHO2_01_FULL_41_11]
MVEAENRISFRESIAQAPEFSQPFVANTLFGVQHWPFQEVQASDGNESLREKVVFEAHGRPSEETDPMVVRVSYEATYGLQAKRTVILRKYPEELLMQSAEVRYNFGDIDISVAAGLSSPIVTSGILSDPESFQATIGVLAGDKPVPPLALVDYHYSSQIPLNADFVHGDYKEALEGDVEKRDKKGFSSPSYRKTYFQWEHLAGAMVGVTRYDDPKDSDYLRYYKRYTKINNREPVQLEGSPYRQKISRSEGGWRWGEGRLRFARMNSEVGESWMFSIPEWVNKHQFHRDIQHSPLSDFSWKYPVVFCVKRRGEERQWSSTWSNRDKVR